MKQIMKKVILATGVAAASAVGVSAQQASVEFTKGNVEVEDFGAFKLHVYNTNDVMADASYIVEGAESLVTLEQPLFKDNVTEFDAYLASLGKPVEKRIADYHLGGTGSHGIVMAAGMAKFTRVGAYAAMMSGFAQSFGDAIVGLPTGSTEEVPFDETQTWSGVDFTFRHGATTDFPAASIVIGGKAYLTHWAPAKAHMNALQISSPAVIDAELAEIGNALNSGCEAFIGCHGGLASKEAAQFKAQYLATMKQAYADNTTADSFVAAMRAAYPALPGEEALAAVAANLYK